MSAINVAYDLANAANVIIPLDRWGDPNYSVSIDAGTSVVVEGTLQRVNRGDTAVWTALDDAQGVAIGALLLATGLTSVARQPLEAIRITATGACTGRVMQTGAPQ